MQRTPARGTTLIELMVTLTILAILSGLAAATLGTLRPAPADAQAELLARTRVRAVRTGRRIRLDQPNGDPVLLLPDGRVVGAGLDPLTGAPPDAPR